MTSHDAVFKLRKILHEKKIGHGGTLDPDVTGVLPIAVGKATRVIEYMTEAGKVYEGEITIGFSTTTEDTSGDVVQTTPLTELDEESVDKAMSSFEGQITQTPPMYSAVKVNGKNFTNMHAPARSRTSTTPSDNYRVCSLPHLLSLKRHCKIFLPCCL